MSSQFLYRRRRGGVATYTLPPGQHRINISGATGLYAALTRVPV